jgi:dual specificity protein kinase YAK1
MEPGWQPYQDPLMGHPAQFNTGLASHPQQLGSKYGQPPQSQPPVGYTYESFQPPGTASKPPSAGTNSKTASMASSPAATPRRDYVTDADTTMEDADPYNRAKYPSRPNHNRASSQFLNQAEESSASSAARRYSPMNVLSPPMSYPTSPGKAQSSYGFPSGPQSASRRSPARPEYASPPQGYQSPSEY